MNMKEVLQEVSRFIEEVSGYPTVITPVKANIPRPYATLSLTRGDSLTQGKTYLDSQENLMREWQINFLCLLNFFTDDISHIEEVRNQFMGASPSSSLFSIKGVSSLEENLTPFEAVYETSFTFELNIRATLTTLVEESAPHIQTITVKEV